MLTFVCCLIDVNYNPSLHCLENELQVANLVTPPNGLTKINSSENAEGAFTHVACVA